MKVGDLVKEKREKKGFSQKKLSQKSGVSQSSIHYIESNKTSPSVDNLKKIAFALGVPVIELIDDTDSGFCKTG